MLKVTKEEMTMFSAFLYGFVLAFGLIIPLGVQNLFVFNQGASQRHYWHALPSVLTAFICDVILILCAVLGISLVVFTIPWLKEGIFLLGSLFLLYMGWLAWHSEGGKHSESKPLSAKYQIAFALSVSLLNPHALVDTIGVIGTNSLSFAGEQKWAFTLACILVSFAWFLGLSLIGHYFKKIDKTGKGTKWVSKLSAFIMWLTAFYLAWQLLYPVLFNTGFR